MLCKTFVTGAELIFWYLLRPWFKFCHGPRRRLNSMAMAPSIQEKLFDKKTRANISKIVFNCNSIKSSDIRQEQTCCQDIATVCISNSQYLGFGGPCISAVSALVFISPNRKQHIFCQSVYVCVTKLLQIPQTCSTFTKS